MGFSWYFYTRDALTKEEIENSINILEKFAKANKLRYYTLPKNARQFGKRYVVDEGTYKEFKLAKVDTSSLKGIQIIFLKPNASEAFNFVPNSQRHIAFGSCKTRAKEPQNTMVEKILQMLVETTNGKLFAYNDVSDLIGEAPEDWFTQSNPEEPFIDPPRSQWYFHTSVPLDVIEIENSIDELTKYARERNLSYVILPMSLEELRKCRIVRDHLERKGYGVLEGTDRGSTPVNRNPLELRGIIIRVNDIEFDFVPNSNKYIAFSSFWSEGREKENEVAEEILNILYRTTHGKLYAHLDAKDGTKIIGELPEYHHKIDKK